VLVDVLADWIESVLICEVVDVKGAGVLGGAEPQGARPWVFGECFLCGDDGVGQ